MQIQSIFIILIALIQISQTSVEVLVYKKSEQKTYILQNILPHGNSFQCKLSKDKLIELVDSNLPTYFLTNRIKMDLYTGPKGKTIDPILIKNYKIPKSWLLDFDEIFVTEELGECENNAPVCQIKSDNRNIIVGFSFRPEIEEESDLESPVTEFERVKEFDVTFGKEQPQFFKII